MVLLSSPALKGWNILRLKIKQPSLSAKGGQA
jgi:hypothetical protein